MAMISYGRKKTEQFYMDKRLKRELDILLHFTKNRKKDLVIVVDGEEGAGKSVLTQQICKYCSIVLGTPFGLDNIHFDLNDYIDLSLEKGLNWINDLDESRKILNKKRSMSRDSVRFTNYLSECRSKQQVHVLVVPSYHDLDQYIINHRMAFLIQVLTRIEPDDSVEGGYELIRGDYVIHGKREARHFYNTPELRYRHPRFKNTDLCQFKNHQIVDEKEYDTKKEKHTVLKYHSDNVDEEILSDRSKKVIHQRNILIKFAYENKLTQQQIGNMIGLDRGRIGEILRKEGGFQLPTDNIEINR